MRTGDREIRWHFPGNRFLTLAVLAVMVLVFSVFAKNFFSVKGILNLLVQTCPFTIVGIGSVLVLIVGGIDFSLGALVALGGVGVLWFLAFGLPVWASMVTAIAVCGLVGCLNGFLITRLRLPPFLATLGMSMVIYGFLGFLAYLAFNLPPPPHPIPDSLGDLASKPVLKISARDPSGQSVVVFPGISWIIIITAITAALFQLVSNRTRMGRRMRLVGSNEMAARFSGIRVERVKLFAYALAAALAALSGVLLTSRLGLPPGGAVGYEMVGITCAMIGGASLSGGVGSVGGTVVGSLIISVLGIGLTMLNNSNPALPLLFNGVVVLAAVYLDQIRSRRKPAAAIRF